MKFLLYLVGPILGTSYGESTDWREYVAKKLPGHIIAVSPMRGKKYLSEEKNIKHSYEEYSLSSSKGIVCRDRFDVMRGDAVLANFLGAKTVSIGSSWELAWADLLRKPIIISMEKGNVHDHAFVRTAAGFIVPTLDEAIEIAIAVLSPIL